MDLLILDLGTGTFELKPQISLRDKVRAEYTRKLLQLNNREGLVIARKNACKFFWTELSAYLAVIQATSLAQLQLVINKFRFAPPYVCVNLQRDQAKICLNIQENILTNNHQTVWKEMQRQHNKPEYRLLADLFTQVPEALTW